MREDGPGTAAGSCTRAAGAEFSCEMSYNRDCSRPGLALRPTSAGRASARDTMSVKGYSSMANAVCFVGNYEYQGCSIHHAVRFCGRKVTKL